MNVYSRSTGGMHLLVSEWLLTSSGDPNGSSKTSRLDFEPFSTKLLLVQKRTNICFLTAPSSDLQSCFNRDLDLLGQCEYVEGQHWRESAGSREEHWIPSAAG
ncbi:hypothetical protein R1flu_010058 [Riccia fluitans]|uniref:Uncharacterized protein n=1 Tax=Riccia fluitans TaxID=41844 RepID=A0ABD1Z3W8_9MARC